MGLSRAGAIGWALALAATPLTAQTTRGTVVDAQSGAPLPGASITARRAAQATTSDRLGRFTLPISTFPDTLTIVLIGRRPALIPVHGATDALLLIQLEAQPITLSEVIVTAPAGAARPLEDVGRWQLPLAVAQRQPAAIETDVFRALALIPAVTFSTPLSARPIVRGFDAGESSLRIDGFEVVNLYHIGRVFSAFPADAAEHVTVSAAPSSAANGGALAATVDIAGRIGDTIGVHGGLDLSLASASGWAGGATAGARWFGTVRVVHLSVLDAFSDSKVPYDFQDLYGSLLWGAGRITAFASRDHLFDRELGSGMDWSNVLIGGRWQAVGNGRRTVNLSGSVTRFVEHVTDVPARYSRIDVRNRFERAGVGVDATLHGDRSRFDAGVSLAGRAIRNRVVPRSGADFTTTDTSFRNTEIGLYSEWTVRPGSAALQLGLRLDAAGHTRVLQPRVRLTLPAGSAALGLSVGRAARLYHLVADPQSEPELAFYDFWLTAGENGVPIPVSDHGSLDIDVTHGKLVGRAAVFVSRARGLVELRPFTDQRAAVSDPFRYGRGRAAGVELQVGLRPRQSDAPAVSATYVLSMAERDWGLGWVPWTQDRRHLFRLAGGTRLGRWSLFGTFEAMSGAPVTPVEGVVLIGRPDPQGSGLVRDRAQPAYVFGPEHGARGAGTARFDLGGRYSFKGPWDSRMTLGVSVVNAGFGPVAPLRPAAPGFDPGTPQRGEVRYERIFDLPAVPSVTVRVEF